jgi:radical SAM protein with 4Fe4S-binding SPASM domain
MNNKVPSIKNLCRRPFENLEVQWDGSAYACVPSWLPVKIGNLLVESLESIWTSERASKVRESVSNGSYSNCKSSSCHYLSILNEGGEQSPRSPIIHEGDEGDGRVFELYSRREIAAFPKILSLAYDYTCGLKCPMCRPGMSRIRPGSQDDERASQITEAILRVLPQLQFIKLAGNGEPFDSRYYSKILNSLNRREHKNVKLLLLTNGIGFTKDVLSDLIDRGEFLENVEIAIDAATAETYETIRLSSQFTKLIENLGPISEARKNGKVRRLTFSFVVQRANFREMKRFVDMGREYGVDAILFNRPEDWKVMGRSQFLDSATHLPENQEHAELLRVLRDPFFDSDDVKIGWKKGLKSVDGK